MTFSWNNVFIRYAHSEKMGKTNTLKVSGSKKTKGSKQDSQNLGARKPKGLNRIAKIWEQENQKASTG